MKEQSYVIENLDSFDIVHIFECGQCFRWRKEEDGSFTGIFKKNIVNIKQEKNKTIFKGITETDLPEVCRHYFDLDRDYKEIKEKLSKIDNYMKKSIQHGNGIRIINQDLWETIISFILSANNNIPRIKKMIEKISMAYGKPITYKKNTYYTFPTPEELSKASVQDLRRLGLGFRDKRVYDTTKLIMSKEIDIEKLNEIKDTNKIREQLKKIPGVGDKVADCILLFSTLKRLEAFPIDVWVRRVMNDLYIHHPDESKVSQKELIKLEKEKYGDLAGIAQQYLFYWRRERKELATE